MIEICRHCGHEFDSRHNAKYCSDECRKASRREYRLRRYYENAEVEREKSRQRYYGRHEPKPPLFKACEHCGAEFEARTNAKYCPACRNAVNIAAVRRYQAANPEKVREARRRWREQNRARYNELQRLKLERQRIIEKLFARRRQHA